MLHDTRFAVFLESTIEGVSNVVWPYAANQQLYRNTPTFHPIAAAYLSLKGRYAELFTSFAVMIMILA